MSNELRSKDWFGDGFWVGDWFVEPMRNRVTHVGEGPPEPEDDEEAVQLEPKVMEVLLCMAERPEKTVTKEQFKEKVWTDAVVTDDVLSRCISELRKVFGDDSRDPSYIETIRKTGYRLIAPVRTPSTGEAPSRRGNTAQNNLDAPEGTEGGPSAYQGWAQRLRSTLQKSWGEARERWLVGIGVTTGAILLVSLMLWTDEDTGTATAPTPTTPLTSFPGEELWPALSSSGKQVVFAWRNADSLYQNIYLMQQGADRPLRLSADTTIDWSPTWSPEGRFVAYVQEVDGAHQVAIVPSIGGQDRLVTRLSDRRIHSVSWSPDTSRTILAMSAQRRAHQSFALSILLPDADSVRSLTAPALWTTGDMRPIFSPDGSRIAFIRGSVEGAEDLFVVPVEGGEPTRVTTDSTTIRGLSWTQDGEGLIYSAQRGGVEGLWRVDADGGTPTLLRSASEGTVFTHPTVSGQRLAFTQQSAQLDIWALRRSQQYQTFQAEEVVSSTQEDSHPTISPSGTRLAFISERSGHPEVWVAEMNGTTSTQVTAMEGADLRSVVWSSDGRHIGFVAQSGGESNLFAIPASGGPPSQITDTGAEVLEPRWGRNDRWIYYASNRTGTWEIWRTSLSTSRSQQVTRGGAVAAQESEAGEDLYIVRSDTQGVWVAPLDTTEFPLPTRPLSARDSLQVAENSPGDHSESGASSLSGTARSESAFQQVLSQVAPQDSRNWWVENSGIYFLEHRRFHSAVLTYFDFRSGRTVPIYTFPSWHANQQIAVGPEGEIFAYTHTFQLESDVMFIENFGP
jgi:Tol biopolymer transport system component/DNA-binding winged helix-turn-helix (wHTH) protein